METQGNCHWCLTKQSVLDQDDVPLCLDCANQRWALLHGLYSSESLRKMANTELPEIKHVTTQLKKPDLDQFEEDELPEYPEMDTEDDDHRNLYREQQGIPY